MPRMTAILAGGLVAAMIAAPILAQRGSTSPSPECIREIVKLCRSESGEVRGCVKENFDKLSDECADSIRSRMQDEQAAAEREKRLRERQAQRPIQRYSTIKVTRTLFYGSDPKQVIDVYTPEDAVDDLPVVLFVHGGGWRMGENKYVQSKPAHFTASNYIFASTGYRLLPSSPVEEQAQDVGAAVQAIVGQAGSIGADPQQIVLMGHSAGAHLAALVASDPKYADDAFDAIKGVVLLDGAGYDIPTHMASAGPRSRDTYLNAFGNDPARQADLSPITHAGGRDAPNWLALYVEGRAASQAQSQLLADALVAAGADAKAVPIANTDHGRMSREIGTEAGAKQTEAVDAFLAGVFG